MVPRKPTIAACRLTSANSKLLPASDPGWLAEAQFTATVAVVPLVSVDLCIIDATGRLLVGLRRNAPAQGYWFTPGARIRKNETIANAMVRLGQDELGLSAEVVSRAVLMGAWDHFYADSRFDGAVSTHYVNLPSWISLSTEEASMLNASLQAKQDQHDAWRWLTANEGDLDGRLHPYAHAYAVWLTENGMLV